MQQQISENEYVQKQMYVVRDLIKEKDKARVEEGFRKHYCEENNLPYEPKQHHEKGKGKDQGKQSIKKQGRGEEKGNQQKEYLQFQKQQSNPSNYPQQQQNERPQKQQQQQHSKRQQQPQLQQKQIQSAYKYQYNYDEAQKKNNFQQPEKNAIQSTAQRHNKKLNQNPEHYKKTRNTHRMEKHIKSNWPDHQKMFGTKTTKRKFRHYEFKEFDDDFNRESDSDDSRNQKQEDRYHEKQYNNNSNNRKQRNNYQDYQYERYDKNYKSKYSKKHQRKDNRQLFEQYYTQEQLTKLKQENEVFEGIFIANDFSREKGTVKCPIFKRKVHLNSAEHINRALHGCLVAFKVIEIKKCNNEESEEEEVEDIVLKTVQPAKVEEKQDQEEREEDWVDVDVENSEEKSESSFKNPEKHKVPLTKLQKLQKSQLVGKVVAIVKNPFENRSMVGKLDFRERGRMEEYKGKTKEDLLKFIKYNYYVSFKSVNKRIPWMNVNNLELYQYQLDQEKPVEKYLDYISQRYFAVKYDIWPIDSKYPNTTILKEIGVVGNIEVECEVILTENSIYDNEFSDLCKQELKMFSHDLIAQEKQKRLDLTKEYICSIDPVTARDLDDALSIKEIETGIFEIGVHIADVSHFVKQNTEVDKEAILRTTSVYLVHKVIPMLPRMLCEELCSLNRNVERLAFSVFFCITAEGEVLWDRFRAHKSVINSCAQLSYDIVNQVIQGEIDQFSQGEERYRVAEGYKEEILKEKVLLLNTIAQKRRQKRLEGSLTFEKSKLRFILGADLFPTGYTEEKRGLAQFMVEEWMLLANQFVAKKLIDYDRKTAVLRQHISPKSEKIEFYCNLLVSCGLEEMAKNFDVSTSRLLKETLQKVQQIECEEAKQVLAFRLIRLMEAAQYFVVDNTPMDEWRHYALDFDVYTHFTSPIRRYPDILVHRRLEIALENQEIDQTAETRDKLKAIMDHCNECKLNSRRVSDQCDHLFLALLLKSNPVEVDGYILAVGQQHMDVIIPKFNLERKVEYKNFKNIYKFSVDKINEKKYELVVSYQDPVDPRGLRLFFIKQLQQVRLRLSGTDTFPIEYLIQVKIPIQVFI